MNHFRTIHPGIAPSADSLPALLGTLVAERPSTPFWIDGATHEVRTLSDVVADAQRICNWLQFLGLRPGDRVALISDRFGPWALTSLAAALGHFTVVPLPPTASPAILASLLVRAQPRALLIGPAAWSELLPVFIQRGDPLPPRIIIDEASGLLPFGLFALDDAGDAPLADPTPAPSTPVPAALFYNNGSRGRAEAAAIGFSELRQGLAIMRRSPDLAGSAAPGAPHAVIRCPTTAVAFLFDLWRPLFLGAPILDLSALVGNRAAMAAAIARHQPIGVSLAAADVADVFTAAPTTPPKDLPTRAGAALLGGLRAVTGLFDGHGEASPTRNLAAAARRLIGDTIEKAWFFMDMPDEATLGELRRLGVTALRTYHVSEGVVPCGFVPDIDRLRSGYRIPEGVVVRIFDPGPDGVGEIALQSGAIATETLDISRTLRPLVRRDGFLPTGDIGRIDAAGRLHILGTQTFALTDAAGHTVAAENIARHFAGGPWEALVPVPEALLWPDAAGQSKRWIAVVHGATAAAARAFITARNAVTPADHRLHGLLCSPAAFPLGTHRRLRREALLGALRSAFAAHAANPDDRARAIDWLDKQTL